MTLGGKLKNVLSRKKVNASNDAVFHDETSRITQELYKQNAELAVRNKTLALLRQLDELSLEAAKIEDLAKKMTGAIAIALGYDVASIAITSEDGQALQWVGMGSSVAWITSVLQKIDMKKLVVPLTQRLVSTEILQGTKRLFADDSQLVYPAELITALAAADQSPDVEEVKHTMLYPLRYGGKTLGVLTLSSSRQLRNLSRYEQEAVTGIIGLVALAMYKTDLYVDLQETSAELASANQQLKDLDKAKSEFLSVASHQLYTPLTALRGYVSMLQEGDFGKVPEGQMKVLGILDQSAKRLISLIKGLLDISRIERGKFELNLQSTSLADMAQELVRDLLPNAVQKGLKLEFHPTTTGSTNVVVDRERIRQILLNFIDNSIKYTEKGRIDVSVKNDQGKIVFAVQDTGKGISKDDLPKLFHKFSRVGGASRFHTEGTGLGLYVAEQIVREHKGDVKADSPGEGKGSTFTLILPAEGTPDSLKVGDKREIEIKAAESEK
ncbi:MAG: HAMP domain-containing histidine kinase [Candidatus Andersenbacteria bacterium]|nr:HAMP domain-containing histidine kinase [Candidatus Andersenbacteria bacterium]